MTSRSPPAGAGGEAGAPSAQFPAKGALASAAGAEPSTTPFRQALRPYPIFNNISYADNGANMLYNALQVQVTKRFTKSLMFSSSWTWAKELSTIDDTGYSDLNTQIQNAYNRNADLGNVYAVPRHQWMNNFLYNLPFGKGKLLGDWQLNGLFNLQSGN